MTLPGAHFVRSLYLRRRFFLAGAGVVLVFVAGHFVPALAAVGKVALLVLIVLVGLDGALLYQTRGLAAQRAMPERFSNGDDNAIRVRVTSRYRFPVRVTVIDELPVQLQIRDLRRTLRLAPGQERVAEYTVRPTRRGAYVFGAINVFAESPLGLVRRRYRFEEGREVPVYPSYQQMRKYELLAATERLTEAGVKKVRRTGHTMEFDHIREYVVGDDYRTVNWKATARRGALMVNQYRDERAQPVYCLIDTGRVMKMPFDGMTLLDYSINASLVLANTALMKQDRAGLVTFSHQIHTLLPAERKGGQIHAILEALYRLETDFLETDYARLATVLRQTLRQRSLLLLFTNFPTRSSMQRQLPYLQALARRHVLVPVFFENTELRGLLERRPEDTEDIYVKTIAEKFAFEKREVVKELRRHGIRAVLTPPQALSVNTLNTYLELKARGVV